MASFLLALGGAARTPGVARAPVGDPMMMPVVDGILARMALLVGALMVSVLGLIYVSWSALADLQKSVAEHSRLQLLVVRRLELANDAQHEFLVQIQDWKTP